MTRLIEREVQEAAQGHLEQYYKIHKKLKTLYSQLEARTRKQYGGKRADGLLAYKRNQKKAYVISMEAKSFKTLPALTPYRVNKLWFKSSIYAGLIFSVGSGSMFLAWNQLEYGVYRFLIPLFFWLVGAVVYAFLMRKSYKFQEMPVVHQVFQYPGNEQWVSFSEDALHDIKENLRDNLFKICKARGIGVLLVSSKKQVTMVSKPVYRSKWFGDFLKFYAKEEEIRKFLGLELVKKVQKKKKKVKKKK